MTEPYEHPTMAKASKAFDDIVPLMYQLRSIAPEGQETIYITTLATMCIVNMCANLPDEAVRFFLQTAMDDIPKLRTMAVNHQAKDLQ